MSSGLPAHVESGLAGYPWERPLGAWLRDDETVEFRVWAPRTESISLRIGDERDVDLEHAGHGVYEVIAPAQLTSCPSEHAA